MRIKLYGKNNKKCEYYEKLDDARYAYKIAIAPFSGNIYIASTDKWVKMNAPDVAVTAAYIETRVKENDVEVYMFNEFEDYANKIKELLDRVME